jgi:drug/metabolite transporter (DMT)-like permease
MTTSRTEPAGGHAAGAWLGVTTVVMTLLGWSSVPLFIAHFAHSIDPWTSNGWRYGFSALLWAPVLAWARAKGSMPRGLWRDALVPAAFNAAGQSAFAWSFYNIDPATATFGLRLQIVFVALGAYALFEREREVLRRPAAWAGIALVLVGIGGTLFLADRGNLPERVVGATASYRVGVIAAVSSGLLFAAYGLSVRRFMHRHHPVTAFAAISQYTAAAMVGLMLLLARDPRTGEPDLGAGALGLGWSQFGLFLLSAVIGIALGHVFYYIAIARLGVAVAGAVIQLQPFCVAVAQLWLFGKLLTRGQWVSGSLAVVGAVALLWVQYAVSRRAAEVAAVESAGAEGEP